MSSVEDAGWHFARKLSAEEVNVDTLPPLSDDVRMEVSRCLNENSEALKNEIELLRKLTREAYISVMTFMTRKDVPGFDGAPELAGLFHPKLLGDRLFYVESKKIGKLRYDSGRPGLNSNMGLSQHLAHHANESFALRTSYDPPKIHDYLIRELCAFGQVTESLTEDEHYDDINDLEKVNVRVTGLRGVWERLGITEPEFVRKPKHKIRKKIVGERPMKLAELVNEVGGNKDAYGLIYLIGGSGTGSRLDEDKRPSRTEIEILLTKDLGTETFDAISKDPKLIRRIVARMLAETIRINEEAWLHILPPHHPGFGIPYDEWAEKGKTHMYLHGPEAPEGYFEEYVREIS